MTNNNVQLTKISFSENKNLLVQSTSKSNFV